MKVIETALPGLIVLVPTPHVDARGVFVETWSEAWSDALPPDTRFVRDGQAKNHLAGTVRGLHAQRGLGKLVRVAAGRVLDVLLDLREGSPTYGRHVAIELDADDGRCVWVPPGIAHGYCTLTDAAVVHYRFTGGYEAGEELGVRWDDPALGIAWPAVAGAVVSERDRGLPLLDEL